MLAAHLTPYEMCGQLAAGNAVCWPASGAGTACSSSDIYSADSTSSGGSARYASRALLKRSGSVSGRASRAAQSAVARAVLRCGDSAPRDWNALSMRRSLSEAITRFQGLRGSRRCPRGGIASVTAACARDPCDMVFAAWCDREG